jgi:hypothetical protein
MVGDNGPRDNASIRLSGVVDNIEIRFFVFLIAFPDQIHDNSFWEFSSEPSLELPSVRCVSTNWHVVRSERGTGPGVDLPISADWHFGEKEAR